LASFLLSASSRHRTHFLTSLCFFFTRGPTLLGFSVFEFENLRSTKLFGLFSHRSFRSSFSRFATHAFWTGDNDPYCRRSLVRLSYPTSADGYYPRGRTIPCHNAATTVSATRARATAAATGWRHGSANASKCRDRSSECPTLPYRPPQKSERIYPSNAYHPYVDGN
jgi:hypothetical protein